MSSLLKSKNSKASFDLKGKLRIKPNLPNSRYQVISQEAIGADSDCKVAKQQSTIICLLIFG